LPLAILCDQHTTPSSDGNPDDSVKSNEVSRNDN